MPAIATILSSILSGASSVLSSAAGAIAGAVTHAITGMAGQLVHTLLGGITQIITAIPQLILRGLTAVAGVVFRAFESMAGLIRRVLFGTLAALGVAIGVVGAAATKAIHAVTTLGQNINDLSAGTGLRHGQAGGILSRLGALGVGAQDATGMFGEQNPLMARMGAQLYGIPAFYEPGFERGVAQRYQALQSQGAMGQEFARSMLQVLKMDTPAGRRLATTPVDMIDSQLQFVEKLRAAFQIDDEGIVRVGRQWDLLVQRVNTFIEVVLAAFGQRILPRLNRYFEAITDFVAANGDKIADLLERAFSIGLEALQNFARFMYAEFPHYMLDAINRVAEFVGIIGQAIPEVWMRFLEFISWVDSGIQIVWDLAQRFWAWLQETFPSGWQSFLDMVGEGWSILQEVGISVFQAPAEGLNNLAQHPFVKWLQGVIGGGQTASDAQPQHPHHRQIGPEDSPNRPFDFWRSLLLGEKSTRRGAELAEARIRDRYALDHGRPQDAYHEKEFLRTEQARQARQIYESDRQVLERHLEAQVKRGDLTQEQADRKRLEKMVKLNEHWARELNAIDPASARLYARQADELRQRDRLTAFEANSPLGRQLSDVWNRVTQIGSRNRGGSSGGFSSGNPGMSIEVGAAQGRPGGFSMEVTNATPEQQRAARLAGMSQRAQDWERRFGPLVQSGGDTLTDWSRRMQQWTDEKRQDLGSIDNRQREFDLWSKIEKNTRDANTRVPVVVLKGDMAKLVTAVLADIATDMTYNALGTAGNAS